MEKIKPFCLWIGLSIFLVGIPVLIFSLDLGEDSIWGGREKLQKNLVFKLRNVICVNQHLRLFLNWRDTLWNDMKNLKPMGVKHSEP